jgi:predicted transport protein
MTSSAEIEKFFCNNCKRKTNHFIRGAYSKTDEDERSAVSFTQKALIVECCGCERLALVKKTHFSEDVDYDHHPVTGETIAILNWDEMIYPPVSYRAPPAWFEDLPDPTLRAISAEIYKSLQTESHYLATFGSRTLIDRLIVLTVGDKGNFAKGLQALQDDGMISPHEREILNPVVDAGNAAAHRGWAPRKEQLDIILDTVEGLIHRLLVLPKLAEELEEAVPARNATTKNKAVDAISNVMAKVEAAPKDLRAVYDELSSRLKSLGKDVSIHPQKHYIAFRRNRNFACVQIYNQTKVIRVYLNVDPDAVKPADLPVRDVRQIGHFGTGDLEVAIRTKKDLDWAADFLKASYDASCGAGRSR